MVFVFRGEEFLYGFSDLDIHLSQEYEHQTVTKTRSKTSSTTSTTVTTNEPTTTEEPTTSSTITADDSSTLTIDDSFTTTTADSAGTLTLTPEPTASNTGIGELDNGPSATGSSKPGGGGRELGLPIGAAVGGFVDPRHVRARFWARETLGPLQVGRFRQEEAGTRWIEGWALGEEAKGPCGEYAGCGMFKSSSGTQ
jgi:hypothetical protein